MTDVRERLLTENPWKLMITLSLPAILGQFVVGLYAFVDSIYVGQMVGTSAMSAVSAASPFVLINNGIAVLIGIGSSSVLSRAIGKKDMDTVNRIMGNLTFLVLLLSSISMVAGITFAPILLSLSGAEGAVLEMGVVYLRTVFLGSIFVNFMQSANIVLDPILIIIFPERGPQAVAIATVISQFFQATVTLIYFLKKSPIVRFHGVRPAKDLIPEILSVGVSAMFMQVMMLIQMTVVYNTAVKYGGETQIALMGASQRVMQLAFVPIWGMSQGLQPAVGTNYGAKNYTRVKQLTNIFIIGSTVLSGIFFAVIELFPNQILSAFITESDIVESGISLYRLMFCAFFTYGLLIMTLTYFQALGRAKLAGFIVVFRQLVLVVPMVLLLPVLMRGNVLGVWLALPLNDIVILFIAVILLMREYRLLRKMQSELVLDTM